MGKILDLTGQQFTRLVVQHRVSGAKETTWSCVCNCGGIVEVRTRNLRSGNTTSCGCIKRERSRNRQLVDLTGQVFGRLTALFPLDKKDKSWRIYWQCKCECGVMKEVSGGHLRNGRIQSCGCLLSERRVTHGLSNTNGYVSFKSRQRMASQLERQPIWADLNLILEFYHKRPTGYHVDHIVPLQGFSVSGLHVVENLQYLSPSDNSRKGNRFRPHSINSNTGEITYLEGISLPFRSRSTVLGSLARV